MLLDKSSLLSHIFDCYWRALSGHGVKPMIIGMYISSFNMIKPALDKAEIKIPFPQMDIHHHGLPTQNG